MSSFDVTIDGGNALIKKLQKATETIQIETVKIINDSVKEIASSARTKVPVAKKNGGTLKNSIGFTTYAEGIGATVYANARYAPYVEFGTGDFGFGIPVYPNLDMNQLEAYALTFKKSKPKPFIGMPYRPFMFNSYSEVLGKMVNKIKKIRI
jgi:HK97 gp10 family phage protein